MCIRDRGHVSPLDGGRRGGQHAPPGPEATIEEASHREEEFVKRGVERDPGQSSAPRLPQLSAATAGPANFTIGAQRGASQGQGQGQPNDVVDLEKFKFETGRKQVRNLMETCGNYGSAE